MAITDPTAVQFCNARIRTLADQVARVNATIQLIQAEYSAKGMAALIPNDATQLVQDGSPADGRTPITGADVTLMMSLVSDLVAMATGTNSKMPTVLKVAVNPY